MSNFVLEIEGRIIPVDSARLEKTIDTIANVATASVPWFPGRDNFVDRVLAPYSYSNCNIYFDDELIMRGVLYNVGQSLTSSGRIKSLEIFSKTANVIDSSVRFPFEENNLNLLQRIQSQMNSPVQDRSFGINVIVDNGVDIGGRFKRISASNTDNCFEKLLDLAKQRGCLLSCTVDGDILITKANTNGRSVGTITETSGLVENFEIFFDGRKRYKYYESIATSSQSTRTRRRQTASDSVVTTQRFLTFEAQESLPGEAVSAAEWQKNKSAADALSFTLPVNSWKAPNGTIWKENSIVTVVSETIGVPDGFNFLINRVEFVFDSSGNRANLELKPPSLFTTGEIIEPWLRG